VDPSTGASSLLYNTAASSINCLAVAPTGWGSHGGHVITATNTGVVLAVDPGVPSMTTIASGLSSLSDCEFGADGRLYVVAYSTNSVIVVGPTGTTTTIATGFSSADGIALDTARDRMWVADSSLDQLFEVVISTGTRTLLGSYDFDSGYYPSGLVFDGVNTLIMSTGESSLTLRAISVP
jgi:sugar lactone lactonase YvrE